jgi:two-component system, OmpR family, response regulator
MEAGSAAPPRARVLVVEDDAAIRDLVRRYLTTQEFDVLEAADGPAARAILAQVEVDLILLDLGLPGEDGLTFARDLRAGFQGGVIIVSGRGESVDRIVGLELGADDYVAKPFELRELLARMRSVLRRVRPAAPRTDVAPRQTLRFANFNLDRAARRLTDEAGRDIALTTGEYDLLVALLEQPGTVLSRDRLMQRLRGRTTGPFDRAIDVQIGRLRQKIEADPANPTLIRSVRGAGYVFSSRVQTG